MLKARQTKYAAYAIIYILVVVAIVVVANVLADRYNKTYDGTANKRYSLSDQTRPSPISISPRVFSRPKICSISTQICRPKFTSNTSILTRSPK